MPRGQRRRIKAAEIVQIHMALRKRFRKAGHGSIRAAEEALGLQKDYYRHYRHQGRLDTGVLLATLEHLGVDAGEFFAELFGGGRVPPGAGGGRVPPGAGGGSGPGTAAERLAAAICRAEVPAKPADRDESLRAELEAWLGRMDDWRYEDPEAALVELWSRAEEIPGCLAARYLGVCGSCYRMIGNLGDARECLLLALEWADGDDEAVGDVLQRLACVEKDGGAYETALQLAERATGLYVRTGNRPRVGQALVDQAKYLILLEEPRKAKATLVVAKRYVTESDRRNRFAIEQYLVAIARQLRHVDACRKHVDAARKIAPDPLAEGMLLATLGDFCRDLGRFGEAVAAYREEIELVAEFPLNALLATVDLVYVLARQRCDAEAVAAARSVNGYMGCLRGNRLAEAALVDLFNSACKGVLRSSEVARLREAVRRILDSPRTDSLGDRLRRCRRLRGISRSQAAAESGVPAESLRKIESGVMPGTVYAPRLRSWLASYRPELVFAEGFPAGADPRRKQ